MWSLDSLINRGHQRAIDWPTPSLTFGGNHSKGSSMDNLGEALAPETEKMVDDFAAALKAKLRKAQNKYGRGTSWMNRDWHVECLREMQIHIGKGDPLDVAAYAAFCWWHKWSTSPAMIPQDLTQERAYTADDMRFEAAFCVAHGVQQNDELFARQSDDPALVNRLYLHNHVQQSRVLWDCAKAAIQRLDSDDLDSVDILGMGRAFLRRIIGNDAAMQVDALPLECAMRTALILARREWHVIGGYANPYPPLGLRVYAGYRDKDGEFKYGEFGRFDSSGDGWLWSRFDQDGEAHEDDDYSYLTHWRYLLNPPVFGYSPPVGYDHVITAGDKNLMSETVGGLQHITLEQIVLK